MITAISTSEHEATHAAYAPANIDGAYGKASRRPRASRAKPPDLRRYGAEHQGPTTAAPEESAAAGRSEQGCEPYVSETEAAPRDQPHPAGTAAGDRGAQLRLGRSAGHPRPARLPAAPPLQSPPRRSGSASAAARWCWRRLRPAGYRGRRAQARPAVRAAAGSARRLPPRPRPTWRSRG